MVFSIGSCYAKNQEKIDSLKETLSTIDIPAEHRGNTLSEIGSLYYQEQNYAQSINFKKQSLSIYQALGDMHMSSELMGQIGVIYSLISDYENSLKYFLEAQKTLETLNDEAAYYALLLNIGTTYIEAADFNKGLSYIKQAIDYYNASPEGNELYLLASYSNAGVAYNGLGVSDSAIYFYKKSIDIANQFELVNKLGGPQVNLGELYLEQNNPEEAMMYFQSALASFEKSSDTRGIWHTKSGIASVYKYSGADSAAIELFKEAITYFKTINDYNYQILCLRNLSEIYQGRGDLENALKYQLLLGEVKDSLSKSETLSNLTHMQMQYDIEKLEKENESKVQLLEKEQKISTLNWYLATGVLIIVLILIITLYNRNKNQKKLIEAQLTNSTLEQNQLKNELTYRNQELENFALHIVQKNALLGEIKSKLKPLKSGSQGSNVDQINDLSLKINQSLRINKELEKFRERVDEVNGAFFSVLNENYPDLTEKEKRLCALLKLNLASKEIALLNGVSEGAITMARYRLRKKMGLQNEDNLTSFLNDLF